MQSVRHFQGLGDFLSLIEILHEDMITLFTKWIENGANMILAMDANENVCNDMLVQQLVDSPLHMTCMIERLTGTQAPNLHHMSQESISTSFGTSGLALSIPWYTLIGMDSKTIGVLTLK
jgi:hypothetical protein